MEFRLHREVIIDFILKHKLSVIAEIGVWKSHMMRKILKSECSKIITEYWAIDKWEVLGIEHGHMSNKTKEDWDSLYFNCCKYLPWFKQLRIIREESTKTARIFNKFVGGYFDLVFIDASHFYEDVLRDIKAWKSLVKKGGFISGHDYDTGQRKNHNVKQAVDEIFGIGNVELYEDGVWIKQL